MRELVADGFAIAKHGKGNYVTDLGEKALVGMVIPFHGVFAEIYINLIARVRHTAACAGHRTLHMSSDENPGVFANAVDELVNIRGARWLVVVPPTDGKGGTHEESLNHLESLRRRNKRLRIAVVDREAPQGFFQVRQNRLAGARMLLELAAKTGRRKVLFLDNGATRDGKLRRGISGEAKSIDNCPTTNFERVSTPARDIDRCVSGGFDAVFCNTDDHARGMVCASRHPFPFALAGYNGTVTATSLRPLISTVNSSLGEAGRLAFEYVSGSLSSDGTIHSVEPFFVAGETF